MRKLLLVLASNLLFCLLVAQEHFEIIVEEFGLSDGPGELYQAPSGRYVLFNLGQHSALASRRNSFLAIDSHGEKLLHYQISPETELGTIWDVMELPDSSTLIIQKKHLCQENALEIHRLDKNWVKTDSFDYQSVSNLFAGQFSDSSLVIFSSIPGEISRITLSGETIWISNSEHAAVDIITTPGDSMVYSALRSFIGFNSDSLLRVDKNGDVTRFREDAFYQSLASIDSSRFLGFTQNLDSLVIWSLDDFIPINGVALGGGIRIRDVAVSDAGIAVLTEESGTYDVLFFNSELTLQNSFELPGSERYTQIAFLPSGFLLAGQERYGDLPPARSSYYAFLKSFSFDGSTLLQGKDVGVISLDLEAPLITFRASTNDYEITFSEIRVTVKNYDNTPLQQVTLNTSFPKRIPVNCPTATFQRFARHFDNLNLAPGQEAELLWENLTVTLDTLPASPLEQCFWTSLPDDRLETNNENDFQCQSLLLTSNREPNQPPAASLIIFPNPSPGAARLNYQLPTSLTGAIHIYNSLGREVAVYPLQATEGSLSLDARSPGIYFVVLFAEGVPVKWGKWVQR